METKPKNRDWVKNAAIIFLAVLLVLTFFSNTIMNRTLPEVATQYVTDGSITAKVRGTGTVTANGNHQVKADQTREIRAVMVRAGQKVEPGDVLFVLGSGESSELEAAQEQLRQLQLSYQRTALSGSTANYDADQIRVDAAKEAADEAKLVLDAVIVEETYGSERMQALRNQVDEWTNRWNEAKAAYDQEMASASAAVGQAKSDQASAKKEVILAEGWDEENLTEEQNTLLENPQTRIAELEADPESDPELLNKWRTLKDRNEAVAKAEADRDAVSYDKVAEAENTLLGLQQEIEEAIGNSAKYRDAKAAYDAAYTNYLDLAAALEARKAADNRASALIGLELADLGVQIEAQKKKIAELSGGEENQIVANVGGTIQSIECTAGDTVAKDSVLCVIEVPDMGYTLSFSVTNEQAARLKVGDSATVSNYYWGSQIVATLESIRVDPKNPQTNKLLTFEVTGDVTAGTELTISVGQRSANYDTIIPKSAIHNDANGDFVFKVEAKNSPLGNRYIARRVSVEILAQDDTNAAVTGDLGWGDFVITTSNAPIKNGDLVRLAD